MRSRFTLKNFTPFLFVLFCLSAFADTPPPGSVKAKLYTGDGATPITATSGSLNVNVTNSSGATTTVNQGAAGVAAWLAQITSSALPANACQETGGHLSSIDSKLTSPLAVTGTFFQATQPVSGTLTCNAGSGTLLVDASAHTQPVSIAAPISISNFPVTQPVSGAVSVSNFPSTQAVTGTFFQATQPVSGSVSVSNFPASQAVTGTFFQATQPVSISGLPPLATGSNTIGNVNINGTVPVSGSITATNSANGATAAAVPSQATQVAGVDGSGNLRAIKVSGTGVVSVDGSAVTQPVSGSVSVSNFPATQPVSGSISVSNFPASQAVTGTFFQATQPVSGTVTANAGTNLNTSALALESGGHLSSMDLKMPALGQALASGSVPIVLTASQLSTLTPLSTITANAGSGTFLVDGSGHTQPVSGTFFQATQPVSLASLPALATGSNTIGAVNINGTVPVSGSITATNSANGNTAAAVPTQATQVGGVDGSGNLRAIKTSTTGVVSVDGSAVTQPVSGTFFQATQPVSAAALPLPAGAATAAKQPALGTAGSASADVITVQGAASMTALKVDGSAVTQPTSLASLPALSAGSATIGAVKITDGTNTVSVASNGGLLVSGAAAAGSPPTLNPISVSGIDGAGNKQHLKQITGTNALVVDGSAVTQPVSAASLPLPALAATSTKQSDGSQKTQNVDGAGSVVGPNATIGGTNYIPVVQASSGVPGSAVPARSTVIAGSDGTNAQTLSTDSTGKVNVNNISGTVSLPTGAATSALQTSGNASLTTIAANSPIGPALSAASRPVVLATDSAAIPVQTAADHGASGNLTALNSAVSLVSNGSNTAIFELGGTWTGTVTFEGSNNAFTTSQAITSVFLGGIQTQSANATANGYYSVLPQGFSQVRARMSAYTSGTATVLANTSAAERVIVPIQGNPNNLQALVTQGAAGATAWKVDGSAVTQPVSATSLPLPTGAATSALQTSGNASLATLAANTPAAGQTNMAGSSPVAIASDQSSIPVKMNDGSGNSIGSQSLNASRYANTSIVGDDPAAVVASGAALNADIFASQDITPYAGASVQITGGFTATASFQGSNDAFTTASAVNCWLATTSNAAPVTTAAAAGTYWCPRVYKQFRVRLTSYTSGTVTGTTQLMATAPESPFAKQSVIASGTVTTVSTVTSVGSMTSGNLGIPGIIADVASAAITTTTTTAAFTPTFGVGYKIQIPVTAVSGTTPTNITAVQESADSGTNWMTVYTFPTITATGSYESPPLFFKGNRVRYVQTIAGTTPSFTRAINRLQMSAVTAAPVNNNATFAQAAVNSVTTLTAPQNAIGFVLQNLSTNTTNLRYAIGATASASNGIQVFPGQDTGEIHAGQNISICPESGTITYAIQWIQQ